MSHPYLSQHFNLESVPVGWSNEDFRFGVEVLEALDRRMLFNLLGKFNIRFDEKVEKYLEDEDIISALLDDVPKDDLLATLKDLIHQKPYSLKPWSWTRNSA